MLHPVYANVVFWALVFLNYLVAPLAVAQSAGPVAAYGFNEGSGSTVSDVSGNNNTGTLATGISRTTQGKFGSALVFNGASAYFGSWCLSHEIPAEQIQAINQCEFVWISHGHPDHL